MNEDGTQRTLLSLPLSSIIKQVCPTHHYSRVLSPRAALSLEHRVPVEMFFTHSLLLCSNKRLHSVAHTIVRKR